MKLIGPTEVVALAASISKSAVFIVSLPSAKESALSGVPPLRVCLIHCEPSAVPENSSDFAAVQPAPERMRKLSVLTADVFWTLSVAR